MKSFTFALLAATTFASVQDDVTAAVTDFAGDALREIEKAKEEAPREIEREMSQIAQELECWWADRNNGDGDCQMRRQEAEMNECWQTGKYWSWDIKQCFESEKEACEPEGGAWASITTDWGTEEFCDRDGFEVQRRECWNTADCSMTWDWQNNTCIPRSEECNNDGGKWEVVTREWGTEEFCDYDGLELLRRDCWAAGNDWVWEDPQYCKVKALVMARVDISVNKNDVDAIVAPIEASYNEGADLANSFGSSLEALIADASPAFEAWGQAQMEIEQKAAEEFQNLVLDSITVDGTPLRSLVEGQMLNMKSNSVRNMVRQAIMQDATDPTQANISITIPEEEELYAMLSELQMNLDAHEQRVQEIVERFAGQYEDLNREVEHALNDAGEEFVETVINPAGDFAKSIVDTAEVTLTDTTTGTTTGTTTVALMKTTKAAENNASDAYLYAGASFGAIGIIAAGALLATFSKKQTADNEESLL